MGVSAEIRWFWSDQSMAARFERWFDQGWNSIKPLGHGAPARIDAYLLDLNEPRLSVKARAVNIGREPKQAEIKGLVDGQFGQIDGETFSGAIELWSKWVADLDISAHPSIEVEKRRLMRRFKLDDHANMPVEFGLTDEEKATGELKPPRQGCNIEFTSVRISKLDLNAWTFALEAFGEIRNVAAILTQTAGFLETCNPPPLDQALVASYPAWLLMSLAAHEVRL